MQVGCPTMTSVVVFVLFTLAILSYFSLESAGDALAKQCLVPFVTVSWKWNNRRSLPKCFLAFVQAENHVSELDFCP